MPVLLEGSCNCGGVRFSVESHAPHPYQRCYCSICRKTGGSDYSINLLAVANTLKVQDDGSKRIFQALLDRGDGRGAERSTAERHFCNRCGAALWAFSPEWPALVHPVASAIDTQLPKPPALVHMMLGSKAAWVEPQIGAGDLCFDGYPRDSIEDWHRSRGLWID